MRKLSKVRLGDAWLAHSQNRSPSKPRRLEFSGQMPLRELRFIPREGYQPKAVEERTAKSQTYSFYKEIEGMDLTETELLNLASDYAQGLWLDIELNGERL